MLDSEYIYLKKAQLFSLEININIKFLIQKKISMALYFGVLDIRRTGSEYAEIYNLIYDCFELDTIFLYPGLQINEIFLKINRTGKTKKQINLIFIYLRI